MRRLDRSGFSHTCPTSEDNQSGQKRALDEHSYGRRQRTHWNSTHVTLSAQRRSRKRTSSGGPFLRSSGTRSRWKNRFRGSICRGYFGDGEGVFLQGFLRKAVCRAWFFRGEVVVNCVVNVVLSHHVFRERKTCHILELFFLQSCFGKPWADPCLYG
jgi:hypothetical protein